MRTFHDHTSCFRRRKGCDISNVCNTQKCMKQKGFEYTHNDDGLKGALKARFA
ncbi:hypothetical protein HanPI659440_Chr04g0162571 [Helianthus annuus]|nr:hypothetical protein HanPI659440_Chr04g0162571 [Helianthus annuus]